MVDIVKDAAQEMRPYFGLSDAKPKIAVDQDNGEVPFAYHQDTGIIFVREKHNSPEFGLHWVGGEEVCHFLHHVENPAVFAYKSELVAQRDKTQDESTQREFIKCYNFIEAVGCYGGLIYASKRYNDNQMNKLIASLVTTIAQMLDPAIMTYSDAKHGAGYTLALKTFLEHNDTKLAEFARLPPAEGIRLIESS